MSARANDFSKVLNRSDYFYKSAVEESPDGETHLKNVRQLILTAMDRTKNKCHLVFFGFGLYEPLEEAANMFDRVTIVVGDIRIAENRIGQLTSVLQDKCRIILDDLSGGYQMNFVSAIAKQTLIGRVSRGDSNRHLFLKNLVQSCREFTPKPSAVLKESLKADCVISSMLLSQLTNTSHYLQSRFEDIFLIPFWGYYDKTGLELYAALSNAFKSQRHKVLTHHITELSSHAADPSSTICFIDTIALSKFKRFLCVKVGWNHSTIYDEQDIEVFLKHLSFKKITPKKTSGEPSIAINLGWENTWQWTRHNKERWKVAGAILNPLYK